MIPLLFLIYVGIELVEYKFGNKIRENVQKAGRAGPAAGAIAGSFPRYKRDSRLDDSIYQAVGI